jgi:mannose-6-phosphate isomerase
MPVIQRFEPRELGQKPWGRELLIAETDTYIGKVMWMAKGHGGPLQFHEVKDETFYLLSGIARVSYHDEDGQLQRVMMYPGEAYHIPPGAVHQVEALQDCILIEASTPVFNDRVAVE